VCGAKHLAEHVAVDSYVVLDVRLDVVAVGVVLLRAALGASLFPVDRGAIVASIRGAYGCASWRRVLHAPRLRISVSKDRIRT